MGAPSIRQFILSQNSPIAPELENPVERPALEPESSPAHHQALSEYLDGISQSHGADILTRHGPPQRSAEQIQAQVEVSLRGIATTERAGDLNNRPYFYYALQDLYVLMAMTEGEVRERHTRDFIGVAERYMNFLDRFNLPDAERFHFLYPALQFTHAALRIGAQEAEPSPAQALMQNLLRQLHQNLIGYHQAMAAQNDPLTEATRGLTLDLQIREALLDGNYEQAGELATQLAQFRVSRDLPAEPSPWYDRWEVQLRAGDEGLVNLSQIQSPPVPLNPALLVSGLTFDIFAHLAAGLDAANELSQDEIEHRFNLMTLVVSPLLMERPEVSLDNILLQLTTEGGRAQALRFLNQARHANPDFQQRWEELFPGTSLEDNMEEVSEIAAQWLEYREGPGQRVMAPLLQAQGDLLSEEIPVGDFQEILSQYTAGHLEIYQALLQDPEAHEIAAIHSAARYLSQQEEVFPGMAMPAAIRQQATRIVDRMASLEFRLGRILDPLLSAEGLFIMGSGLVFGELFPAFLIGRAGTTGRLGPLVSGGRLTGLGAVTTGAATGTFLSLMGSGIQNGIRYHHGLSTHFFRDFGTGSVVNGLTFMAAMGAGHRLQRWLQPNPTQGRLLGTIPWGRHLLVRGGTAAAGGTVAWMGGIGMRGALTGEWTTSADEAAANYLNMAAFELGSMGFSALRRQAALRSELGVFHFQEAGSLGHRMESGASRLFVNRFFPYLGSHRRSQVDHFSRMMMMPEGTPQSESRRAVQILQPRAERFDGEQNLFVRQIGLEEMIHPGFLNQLFHSARPYGMVTLGETPPSEIAWSSHRYDPIVPEAPSEAAEAAVLRPAVPAESLRPPRRQRPRDVHMMDAAELQRRVAEAQELLGSDPANSEAAEASGPRAVVMDPAQSQEVQPGHSPFFGVEDNLPGTPRQAFVESRLSRLGEISALTEVGGREQNEDGVGFWIDPEGRGVMIVADGMGGHHGGDLASAAAIRGFFDFLVGYPQGTLFEAFEAAHAQVQQLPPPPAGRGTSGAAASAIRVDPAGRVEFAQIGDTQVFVARWQVDGSYQIERVAMPDNYVGRVRDLHPTSMDTAHMHSAPMANHIGSFLGRAGESLSPIHRVADAEGHPNPVVYRPEALRLAPNDIIMLMSDGIEGQFLSQEFAGMMHGRQQVGEIAQVIRDQALYRQGLRGLIRQVPAGGRLLIQRGALQGTYMDGQGHMYSAAEGGQHLGAFSPDNVGLIVYRHLGSRGQ